MGKSEGQGSGRTAPVRSVLGPAAGQSRMCAGLGAAAHWPRRESGGPAARRERVGVL